MSRRIKPGGRCEGCRLHRGLCLCALIPRLETRTRLLLVIHYKEERKSTNSGRLGAACLVNSHMLVRGRDEGPSVGMPLDENTQPLLLFPAEDALPLTRFVSTAKPITLIVPDGTWGQAARVRSRVAGLASIPCVALPPGPPSLYRLRAESREHDLSTMEAIARAFGILEGAHVQHAIEQLFMTMVERTLWTRGRMKANDVNGGIPGILRDDAVSG